MIEIQRTYDMQLVRDIWTHPKLYHWMIDDTCPKAEHFMPQEHHHMHYLLVKQDGQNMGVILFHPISFYLYEIHIGILPLFWGKKVEDAVTTALYYLKDATKAIKVIAIIPADNRKTYHLAKRCGFAREGVIKQSTIRHGKTLDQNLLGVSLCQVQQAQ
jgi:RimJ/RimL family protein N-acetyltransferase